MKYIGKIGKDNHITYLPYWVPKEYRVVLYIVYINI